MKRVIICIIFILVIWGINAFAKVHPPKELINDQAEINSLQKEKAKAGLVITFDEKKFKFSESEKQLIDKIIVKSEERVRALLPTLTKDIRVEVIIIDRKIDLVGGVAGRADAPGEVLIEISKVFPGGVAGAVRTGLSAAIFHEFHHLSRGWTIRGNKFGQGIPIAAVNEGLAVVFSEEYTKAVFGGNSYPEDVNKWVEEIMALPENANYGEWMFLHPDGRMAIGYRSGNYIIRQAMANSRKNILELSKLFPNEILKLAGIKNN
jgi:uncharacterized protein YjaZ